LIVVDASMVIELLLQSTTGKRASARLFDQPAELHAPQLLDIEVVQVLRRFESRGALTAARALTSLDLLADLPVRRHELSPLVPRIWKLRANLSACDAAYVALAEALGATFLTCDARFGRAPGAQAAVELL
jgi:predicted nucleic acid-binding protein